MTKDEMTKLRDFITKYRKYRPWTADDPTYDIGMTHGVRFCVDMLEALLNSMSEDKAKE